MFLDSDQLDGQDGITSNQEQIQEILYNEECYWCQRSQIDWLLKGDKNTKFFHRKASKRRRRNSISRLEDEHGTWHEGDYSIGSIVTSCFQSFFNSNGRSDISNVLEVVSCSINDEDSEYLAHPFNREEVEIAKWIF